MKQRLKNSLRFNTHRLATMAIMLALTCISVYIPAVQITPNLLVTYQSFFAVLNGILLGAVWGAVTQLIYLFMGLIGLPVFSGGGGGFSHVLKPSFGFLIGFIFSALITGLLADVFKQKKGFYLLAAAIGTLTIYPFGMFYMVFAQVQFLGITFDVALASLAMVPLYLLGDSICLILIALLPVYRLRKLTLYSKASMRATAFERFKQSNTEATSLVDQSNAVESLVKTPDQATYIDQNNQFEADFKE